MPGFLDGQDDQETIEKITVGEEEFTPDELKDIVGSYKQVKELEKDHGSIDKVRETLGRRGQEIGKLKAELDDLKTKAETKDLTPKEEDKKDELEEQLEKAVDILGPKLMEKYNLMTPQQYDQKRLAEKLETKINKLSKEIDGSDGRPKFEPMAILEHMKETGIKDAVKAYKDKFETELDTWKESELAKKRSKGMGISDHQSGGDRQPKVDPITRKNLKDRIKEVLYAREQTV